MTLGLGQPQYSRVEEVLSACGLFSGVHSGANMKGKVCAPVKSIVNIRPFSRMFSGFVTLYRPGIDFLDLGHGKKLLGDHTNIKTNFGLPPRALPGVIKNAQH